MKYNKLLFTLALGLILIANAVFASAAYNYTTVWTYNGNPVNGVRAVNYDCLNANCGSLGTKLSDATSGTNSIMVSYPVPSTTIWGYGTYWFAPDFRAMEMFWRPAKDGSSTANAVFEKYSGTSALINSVTMLGSVDEGQTLSININVQSPQHEAPIAPLDEPDDADLVRDYFSALTNVTLEIKDAGNNIVYNETKQDYIREDTARTFTFTWTPNFTQAGNYNVNFITGVPDTKHINTQARSTIRALTVVNVDAPEYSNLIENPSNPATYIPSGNYAFNITWIDNDGLSAVWIDWNGVIYTPTANGDVYSFAISDLKAGSYDYRWYANDSLGHTNNVARTYIVNKAVPQLTIDITPSDSVENGTQTTATASGCPAQLAGACIFYRDGVAVSNPDIQTFDIGTYNYVYNTTGNENYSAGSISTSLDVWKQGAESTNGNKIIEIDSSELSTGYSFNMNIGDRAKFNFCGAPYYIKLSDIDEDDEEAYFLVTHNSYNFVLEEDEKEELDLNNDGVKDVLFRLEKIVNEDKVKVYIKKISDKCIALQAPKEQLQIYGEQTGILKGKTESLTSTYLILLMIGGIFLIALAIMLYSLGRLRRIKKRIKQNPIQNLSIK